METENLYVEPEQRPRYESDRLRGIQAALLVVRARNEGYASQLRELNLPRVPTQVYRRSEEQVGAEEVPVAEPLTLAERLGPVA